MNRAADDLPTTAERASAARDVLDRRIDARLARAARMVDTAGAHQSLRPNQTTSPRLRTTHRLSIASVTFTLAMAALASSPVAAKSAGSTSNLTPPVTTSFSGSDLVPDEERTGSNSPAAASVDLVSVGLDERTPSPTPQLRVADTTRSST